MLVSPRVCSAVFLLTPLVVVNVSDMDNNGNVIAILVFLLLHFILYNIV